MPQLLLQCGEELPADCSASTEQDSEGWEGSHAPSHWFLSVCLSFLFICQIIVSHFSPVKCSFENSAWSVCDRWKVNGCNRNTEISSLCSVLCVRTELVRCFKHFYHAILTVFQTLLSCCAHMVHCPLKLRFVPSCCHTIAHYLICLSGFVLWKRCAFFLRVTSRGCLCVCMHMCVCVCASMNSKQCQMLLTLPTSDEDEVRYTGPNAPQILKCSSLKMVDLVMHPAVKDFLCDLLNALVIKYNWKQDEGQSHNQPCRCLRHTGSFWIFICLCNL